MASILDGLNTAKLAISAQQYAMSVSQRNTVNSYNQHYTRQDVFFTDITNPRNWTTNGIPGVDLWAARNSYLDKSISYELPALGENLVKYSALREIDAVLQAVSGGGIGTSIDNFFNSFMELSSNPTNSALRWQVLSSAETMVNDFHRVYGEIQRVQNAADRKIADGVAEVNKLTARIADLNGRIEAAQASGQQDTIYSLRDERQQYIEELQGRIGLNYFETSTGSITVTTTSGDAIVLGNGNTNLVFGPAGTSGNPPYLDIYLDQNLPAVNKLITALEGVNTQLAGSPLDPGLVAERDILIQQLESRLGVGNVSVAYNMLDGTVDITYNGVTSINIVDSSTGGVMLTMSDLLGNRNITSSITSGEIGGHLQMRDKLIPGYLQTLDDMADGIFTEVNALHSIGFGINGSTGLDFFRLNTGSGSIARDIRVNITNSDDIAAAGVPGEIGDNTNAKLIAELGAIKTFGIGGNQTIGEMYASLVYTVGADQRNAEQTGRNQQNLVGQLMGQRSAESGVSLNEEAVNLIKYQQAYQASSRIVSVLNILSAEILNFVRV